MQKLINNKTKEKEATNIVEGIDLKKLNSAKLEQQLKRLVKKRVSFDNILKIKFNEIELAFDRFNLAFNEAYKGVVGTFNKIIEINEGIKSLSSSKISKRISSKEISKAELTNLYKQETLYNSQIDMIKGLSEDIESVLTVMDEMIITMNNTDTNKKIDLNKSKENLIDLIQKTSRYSK